MAKVALNMSMKTEENVMFSLCYNMYRKERSTQLLLHYEIT